MPPSLVPKPGGGLHPRQRAVEAGNAPDQTVLCSAARRRRAPKTRPERRSGASQNRGPASPITRAPERAGPVGSDPSPIAGLGLGRVITRRVDAGCELLQALFGCHLIAQLFDDPDQERCLSHAGFPQQVGIEFVEALMGQAVAESDRCRQRWLSLRRPGHVCVVLEGAAGCYPAPCDRSASVFAGVESVSSSFGDQPSDLAKSEKGGVEFGLELWAAHPAGAGASCSRRWAPGAPADVTAMWCPRRASASAWKSTKSK